MCVPLRGLRKVAAGKHKFPLSLLCKSFASAGDFLKDRGLALSTYAPVSSKVTSQSPKNQHRLSNISQQLIRPYNTLDMKDECLQERKFPGAPDSVTIHK